jgi:hypothetical protein
LVEQEQHEVVVEQLLEQVEPFFLAMLVPFQMMAAVEVVSVVLKMLIHLVLEEELLELLVLHEEVALLLIVKGKKDCKYTIMSLYNSSGSSYSRAEGTVGGGAPEPPLGRNFGMPPANNPPNPGGPPTGGAGAPPPPGTGGALAAALGAALLLEAFPATVGADLSFVCASEAAKKEENEKIVSIRIC